MAPFSLWSAKGRPMCGRPAKASRALNLVKCIASVPGRLSRYIPFCAMIVTRNDCWQISWFWNSPKEDDQTSQSSENPKLPNQRITKHEHIKHTNIMETYTPDQTPEIVDPPTSVCHLSRVRNVWPWRPIFSAGLELGPETRAGCCLCSKVLLHVPVRIDPRIMKTTRDRGKAATPLRESQ